MSSNTGSLDFTQGSEFRLRFRVGDPRYSDSWERVLGLLHPVVAQPLTLQEYPQPKTSDEDSEMMGSHLLSLVTGAGAQTRFEISGFRLQGREVNQLRRPCKAFITPNSDLDWLGACSGFS